MTDPLNDTTIKLLRLAADAWAAGAVRAAQRLTAGAWAIVDGCEFVDQEEHAP